MVDVPLHHALPSTISDGDIVLAWKVTMDNGKTWTDVGSTDNHLYLTGGYSTSAQFETVIAIGCINAAYQTPGTAMGDSSVLSNIFAKFATLKVYHVKNGLETGGALGYYMPSPGQPTSGSVSTTAGLLLGSNAECDGWGNLLRDVLAAQGIKGVSVLRITPILPRGVASAKINVKPAAGQNNPNPGITQFNYHVTDLWTSPYTAPGQPQQYILFDPSYGTEFTGSQTPGNGFREAVGYPWEAASLANIQYNRNRQAPQFVVPLNVKPDCNFTPTKPS